MGLYKKTEKFVQDHFGNAKMQHFRQTVFWLKEIYPTADEAMLIAAIAHDAERAFRNDDVVHAKESDRGFLDEEHLKYHQKKGAEIIYDFLINEGADIDLARRVKKLIENHEVGGDAQENALKDADSISFFENNTEHFIKIKAGEVGRKKVKEKFDWMFNRITSQKAKEISRSWYNEAVRKLEN